MHRRRLQQLDDEEVEDKELINTVMLIHLDQIPRVHKKIYISREGMVPPESDAQLFSSQLCVLDHVFNVDSALPRYLVIKIINELCPVEPKFNYHLNALNIIGHSHEQKVTSALRILDYGKPADTSDEYLRWRDHPNFSYANTQAAAPGMLFNRLSGFQQKPQPVQNSESSEMLAMMKNLTTMVQNNQQTTDDAIKELQTQMSTMAGRLNLLETQNSVKLPSQPINPRETVNVVTLRSGTRTVQPEDAEKSKDPKGTVLEKDITDSSQADEVPKTNSKPLVSTYVPPLPFPRRFDNAKKVEQDKEILDIFKKIHVNIPLIDAIRQVPKYTRVLKDLCTRKKRLTGNEVMSVGENVFSILQKKLPPKCKDPGSFDIPVVIGNKIFGKSMLDLGALFNVIPASIYESFNLGPLKETRIVLELADRTNVYPIGIIEYVLVQVNQFVFPADLCVLEMDSGYDASIPLLLGRPFMKTAKTIMDVDKGTLTMKFDDEKIRSNIFGAMRYPCDVHSDVHANILDAG
ncbi:uncharacterized protein LOC113316129 [Papaver somniferum]|uniref:uncharacterized protein LOC113316129 n=1 Tax=Papaver somniferum TaxID=3469 RepID=UPI000E703A77|nr:uncharacterized protein LOC113316129 [Papaver somniferum]